MKWTLGILAALFAAATAAPSSRQGSETSAPTNMSRESASEPVTIEMSTPNVFGDVMSVTPPNTESIELQHLNDDARFYPDYGDKEPLDGEHFTETPATRTKRQVDYNDLNYEMYIDPSYSRRRRDSDQEPFRIDFDIPGDEDTLSSDSEIPTAPSPVSDPDSISTQITYVIISEDSSGEEVVDNVMKQIEADHGEFTTEVIDLAIPSTTNSDSSASTDSFERDRVLRAIAKTVRAKSRPDSESSSVGTEPSSSSEIHPLARKRRQVPYYRLPDVFNYRIGRSVSDSDTDDTEPDDSHGMNTQDMSLDETNLQQTGRVTPLPEFAYEFSELTRPSSTYVDGKLQSYYVPERQKSKRSVTSEDSTEKSGTSTENDLDVVTATYPLGIDATKDNLSLPEGNFLGPRIYAKGDLLQEEQPAVTGIAAPMEKMKSVPVLDGAETETIYSAPINNVNLPLIIPVVGPTSHPGEEPRIELSIPSGYVPYIIQLEPTKNETQGINDTLQDSKTGAQVVTEPSTMSSNPDVSTEGPFVPTVIITPSTPTSGSEVSTQTEVPALEKAGSSSAQATTSSLQLPMNLPEEETRVRTKQKRAGWKDISSAPEGEVELQQQPGKWEFVSNAPTSGIRTTPSTSSWRSIPIGEEELPRQTSAPNAPEGEVEVTPEEETVSTVPTVEEVSREHTANWNSASSAPFEEVKMPKQQTASWKPVPVGEEEQPKQLTPRWEAVPAPAGETENTASYSDNRTVPGDVERSVSGVLPGTPSLSNNTTKLNCSQPNCGSEKSGQAAPDRRRKFRAGKMNQVVPILEKQSVMNPNGSFSYSFKSGNGIQVEESGYFKNETEQQGSSDSGVAQTVQGSYSYTAPDGRIIKVRYVADKNGFRPEVIDLPNN